MTPVEELREAARQLRERAKAATAGPWHSKPGYPHLVLQGDGSDLMVSANLAGALAAWWDCVAIDEEWGEPETAPRIRERTTALHMARVYLGKSTEDGAQ